MRTDEYRYEEIANEAIADPTDENLERLWNWFEAFGQERYWNGESYEVKDGIRLYPIYTEVRVDEYEIIGYELRG